MSVYDDDGTFICRVRVFHNNEYDALFYACATRGLDPAHVYGEMPSGRIVVLEHASCTLYD